jgi:hypothetical protein
MMGRVGVGLEGLRIDAALYWSTAVTDSEEDVRRHSKPIHTARTRPISHGRKKLTAAATWGHLSAVVTAAGATERSRTV